MSKWKNGLLIGAGAVSLMAVGAAIADSGTSSAEPTKKADTPAITTTADKPVTANTAPEAPAESVAQENARLSAESYLDTQAFSRKGLIEQLQYEGFTHAQAEYGVSQTGL